MDTLSILAKIYKNELAEVNEQKILFRAQCEMFKNKIEELEQLIKDKDEEIARLINKE